MPSEVYMRLGKSPTAASLPRTLHTRQGLGAQAVSSRKIEARLSSAETELRVQFTRIAELQGQWIGSSQPFGISASAASQGFQLARPVNHSRRSTLSSELLTFKPPLYSMNPSFRNLFMKKFTLERVVPTISASVSCDTFGKAR
jgi:hypothetical protein